MNGLTATTYPSIDEIPSAYWTDLDCTGNVYYSPEFLKAYETSNPNVDFNYVLVTESNGSAVALANLQTIRLSMDVILKNIKLNTFIKNSIRSCFKKKPLYILFCGNVFLSGEHGIFLKKGVEKQILFNAISKEVRDLARHTKGVQAIFIKDFYEDSLYITDELLNFGYSKMPVEPNMIFSLDPSWKTYDDYKLALKSKYRIKVNKADSTSDCLTAKLFSEADFATYKDELQHLYENTIAKADFNAQVLNLDTYIKLRGLFKEKFIVKAYFLEEKLVGFLSALLTNNHLDAHFIGLNYDLNKQCAIYPRILNDYVRLGIQYQVSKINFGRTASEIKTTIGAEPESLMCYIRHKKKIPNRIAKPFFKMVTIKDFKQHFPFKNIKEA